MEAKNIKNKILIYFFYSLENSESQILRHYVKMISDFKNDDIIVKEINFDLEKDICSRFNVYGIPTLIVRHNKNKLKRYSGALEYEEIKNILHNIK